MKFSLLVGTSQINSSKGKSFGTCSSSGLRHLAEIMSQVGLSGDLIDLPNSSRSPGMASPFSIESGFALNPDELDFALIPELNPSNPAMLPLSRLNQTFRSAFGEQRSLSYQLKRTLLPWLLEHCYEQFLVSKDLKRKEGYAAFVEESQFWLSDFAVFKAAKNGGFGETLLRKMEVPAVAEAFLVREAKEIGLQKYIQFLCYEQRMSLLNYLKKLGIRLFINLPFGVDYFSPDALFHPDAFDTTKQVGCSPEPENGYPEQAWGMPVYQERSEGLATYLDHRYQWLAKISDGVFVDHLVGWCGQYVLDRYQDPAEGGVSGTFLTKDPEERAENIKWYLDLALSKGITLLAEVAGDYERVVVTQKGVLSQIQKGASIQLMRLPRWEKEQGKLRPLSLIPKSSLVMSETHDTSTFLQFLLNRKGRFDDFESDVNLLEFYQS